ncbi:MAG: exodeoxyribonuclease VII small subunit [Oscillospiraceae bacterium]|jgi:exodeoxyribonuclease VII small subunit|nr:exodeoxyribonuclease VII small subunit [Oscillospiraceae bacterium]
MTEKKEPNFEQSLARMDEIIEKLERGDAALEDSMKLYEEGTRLAHRCETLLRKAEQHVSKLTKTPDGSVEAIKMEGNDVEA